MNRPRKRRSSNIAGRKERGDVGLWEIANDEAKDIERKPKKHQCERVLRRGPSRSKAGPPSGTYR
jgi:hypothetical protein